MNLFKKIIKELTGESKRHPQRKKKHESRKRKERHEAEHEPRGKSGRFKKRKR
ncbi:MAG: hypothetical protein P4K78_10735 [Terracidiphilus sp.]|nr:hypothetical protein [Terracidiphilus sp.]